MLSGETMSGRYAKSMVEVSLTALSSREVLKCRTAGLPLASCWAFGRSLLLIAVLKARDLLSSYALRRSANCEVYQLCIMNTKVYQTYVSLKTTCIKVPLLAFCTKPRNVTRQVQDRSLQSWRSECLRASSHGELTGLVAAAGQVSQGNELSSSWCGHVDCLVVSRW